MSEEKLEQVQEEELVDAEPDFPYPYPTLRGIISVFLLYGAWMSWDKLDGVIPRPLIIALIAVCGVLAVYCFVTSYKGDHLRRQYTLQMDAI
ncbi:MAG: hypothetical protein II352_04575, partial [Selenomonadaceae bacterium]|nr:hypothetical protein [Selenomonadaceae bacterium]